MWRPLAATYTKLSTTSVQPDDKKKEIAGRLGEFLVEGEHWKSVCKNPKGDIFPGDRMVEWAGRNLSGTCPSKLGQSHLGRLISNTGITDFSGRSSRAVQGKLDLY
jgi:hypothetical protein